MDFLEQLLGVELGLPARFVIAFVFILVLIAVAAWLMRRFGGRVAAEGSGRGRQPRLGILEATAIDQRRRLVLVRRDNVEHLILIGGPSDIVVEPGIMRGVPQQRPQGMPQGARPPAAQPAPARQAPPAQAAASAPAVAAPEPVAPQRPVPPVRPVESRPAPAPRQAPSSLGQQTERAQPTPQVVRAAPEAPAMPAAAPAAASGAAAVAAAMTPDATRMRSQTNQAPQSTGPRDAPEAATSRTSELASKLEQALKRPFGGQAVPPPPLEPRQRAASAVPPQPAPQPGALPGRSEEATEPRPGGLPRFLSDKAAARPLPQAPAAPGRSVPAAQSVQMPPPQRPPFAGHGGEGPAGQPPRPAFPPNFLRPAGPAAGGRQEPDVLAPSSERPPEPRSPAEPRPQAPFMLSPDERLVPTPAQSSPAQPAREAPRADRSQPVRPEKVEPPLAERAPMPRSERTEPADRDIVARREDRPPAASPDRAGPHPYRPIPDAARTEERGTESENPPDVPAAISEDIAPRQEERREPTLGPVRVDPPASPGPVPRAEPGEAADTREDTPRQEQARPGRNEPTPLRPEPRPEPRLVPFDRPGAPIQGPRPVSREAERPREDFSVSRADRAAPDSIEDEMASLLEEIAGREKI